MADKEYNKLSPEEEYVILRKGTERPFTGKYTDNQAQGTYVCKQCREPLYYSEHKFPSHCGWPSFDDEIPGAVRRETDADGRRVEILCANCGGHLGHVFWGERFTDKNIRHCVNSISMDFVPEKKLPGRSQKVYLASGCFWFREHQYRQLHGVAGTRVGYMGGHSHTPTYIQVSGGQTGHAETVEVAYLPDILPLEELLRFFFNHHDQDNDSLKGKEEGGKYRSAIFYQTGDQEKAARDAMDQLTKKGYSPKTQLAPASEHTFYVAEDKHQGYYTRHQLSQESRYFEEKFENAGKTEE
ncbi:bifunctional methionine sulfoxide reductase B/A protein [Roseivirga sp. BDSF3-8]|uniref:bifunctional methionine sulfoxide reductase B/A protein n=1 Tax=Roseivirga sp. BDSF3-8 TaxID=3241598 RepID=UPI003531B590